jgi:diguanylate cyclase (GGDEF)-like protein
VPGRSALDPVLDLDRFKHVVDSRGHLNGSRTIQEVAASIQSCLDAPAWAVAYAGDEFVVVLPNSTRDAALEKAREIQICIRETLYLASTGETVRLTASFGVATIPTMRATWWDCSRSAIRRCSRSRTRARRDRRCRSGDAAASLERACRLQLGDGRRVAAAADARRRAAPREPAVLAQHDAKRVRLLGCHGRGPALEARNDPLLEHDRSGRSRSAQARRRPRRVAPRGAECRGEEEPRGRVVFGSAARSDSNVATATSRARLEARATQIGSDVELVEVAQERSFQAGSPVRQASCASVSGFPGRAPGRRGATGSVGSPSPSDGDPRAVIGRLGGRPAMLSKTCRSFSSARAARPPAPARRRRSTATLERSATMVIVSGRGEHARSVRSERVHVDRETSGTHRLRSPG